jgi:hypothetical protein
MNDPLNDRIRQTLERSCDDLDGKTASRLNQIRQAALAEAGEPARFNWLPVTGLATAAALVLAVTMTLRVPDPLPAPEQDLADLELVASEDMELVSDLDFYLWLEAELEENG